MLGSPSKGHKLYKVTKEERLINLKTLISFQRSQGISQARFIQSTLALSFSHPRDDFSRPRNHTIFLLKQLSLRKKQQNTRAYKKNQSQKMTASNMISQHEINKNKL